MPACIIGSLNIEDAEAFTRSLLLSFCHTGLRTSREPGREPTEGELLVESRGKRAILLDDGRTLLSEAARKADLMAVQP